MKPFYSRFRLGLVGLLGVPILAAAQNPPAAYDVSTVKPHDPTDQNMSWSDNQDGFRAVNVDLKSFISDAWHLRPDQLTSEPSWVSDLHWDITGKSTELTPEQLKKLTAKQRRQMTQQILADRFHLIAHIEIRTGPVFTLVPAKHGIKLQPIAPTAEEKATGRMPDSGLRISGGDPVVLEAKKISLSGLLGNLALNLHQTVIDKTGLPADAVYTFTLRYNPAYGQGTASEGDAPPMSSALEEQLGLHLESSRGPVKVLVVDHIEKPTAN